MAVTKWTGVHAITAVCECGWRLEANNALGTAFQHAARHGHVVSCEQIIGITYAPEGMDKEEVFSFPHQPKYEEEQ